MSFSQMNNKCLNSIQSLHQKNIPFATNPFGTRLSQFKKFARPIVKSRPKKPEPVIAVQRRYSPSPQKNLTNLSSDKPPSRRPQSACMFYRRPFSREKAFRR